MAPILGQPVQRDSLGHPVAKAMAQVVGTHDLLCR